MKEPLRNQNDIDQEIEDAQNNIHELRLRGRLHEIQTQIDNLETHITALKTQRNALSPVSQLPDEVLYDIFLQARSAFWESRFSPCYYTPSHLNITAVCTRWRRISSAPQLWNVLFLGLDSLPKNKGLPQLLRRSGSVPLDLWVYHTDSSSSFFRSLSPHWDRLRNVSINSVSFPGSFINKLKITGAPLLEYLSLFSTKYSFNLRNRTHHPYLPSLRTLKMFRGTITTGLSHMPCLTSCVIHPATTSTLPISALIQSLKNIPTIEVVEVSRLATSSSDPPPVPITLPNLSKISLSSSAIDVSNLFDSLDYPSSATVAYACDDYTDTIGNLQLTGLTAVCMRLSNPGLPGVAPSISQLSLTLTPWSISLAAFTEHSPFSPHICLSIESEEDSDLTPILTRLCYSLSLPLIPGLSLKGHSYSSVWNHIDMFQQFDPEVLNLVECDGDIFRSFKGYYQREPLFPQLRTLILQDLTIDEDVVAGLVSMLVERIHIGKPVETLIVECCTILVEDMEVSLNELVDIEWDGNRWNSDSDGSFDDESVQTGSDDSDEDDDSEDDDSEDDNSDDDNE